MALCLVMMFGRLGAVTGGNIVGALLFNHCNSIFYISASALLGIIHAKTTIGVDEWRKLISFYLNDPNCSRHRCQFYNHEENR